MGPGVRIRVAGIEVLGDTFVHRLQVHRFVVVRHPEIGGEQPQSRARRFAELGHFGREALELLGRRHPVGHARHQLRHPSGDRGVVGGLLQRADDVSQSAIGVIEPVEIRGGQIEVGPRAGAKEGL
jgi:hypothetical protein